MNRLAARTTLVGFALLLAALASAQMPPWGDAARDAEVATSMEALLLWSEGSATAWLHDGAGFETADGLVAILLSAVVDPATPEYGVCASPEARCEVEGEEEIAGRATCRMRIEQPGLGPATVWVDLATGLSIASEGEGEAPVRSELVRLDEGAPDPGRFVP